MEAISADFAKNHVKLSPGHIYFLNRQLLGKGKKLTNEAEGGFVIIFKQYLVKLENTFFIFDTIGLALFVVVGVEKTLMFGFPFWVAIVMGTITGSVGSIIRDILINEEPLLFRKDIYALACVAGGIMFYLGEKMGFNSITNQSICGISVVAVRLLAVKFHWSLPALKDDTTNPIKD